MGRKIGIIVVALILGVAFAGELMVLSAQNRKLMKYNKRK